MRKLPAAVYDAIVETAEQFGGIGYGQLVNVIGGGGGGTTVEAPVCLYGVAIWAGAYGPDAQQAMQNGLTSLYELIEHYPIQDLPWRRIDALVQALDATEPRLTRQFGLGVVRRRFPTLKVLQALDIVRDDTDPAVSLLPAHVDVSGIID
jgi:hypothetical protein